MKINNQQMAMAMAIGKVSATELSSNRIELGEVNPGWSDYKLVYNKASSERLNDTYSVYYNGDFGKEKAFTRLMMIEEGYNIGHAVHLLIQGIVTHQQEIKKKKT